ncbi:hypothetical protein ABMY28_24135, partial [Vibrio vulnificus]|uniref:hypothetical protein n=1 Tax=Vibrio vulnificus TaxID=672 RepID=UPI00405A29FD
QDGLPTYGVFGLLWFKCLCHNGLGQVVSVARHLTRRYTALTLEQSALDNKSRQKTAFNVTVEI